MTIYDGTSVIPGEGDAEESLNTRRRKFFLPLHIAMETRALKRFFRRKRGWLYALFQLARLPYWHRLWIVQEIMLAKRPMVITLSGLIALE
jgi:hypothetical protein